MQRLLPFFAGVLPLHQFRNAVNKEKANHDNGRYHDTKRTVIFQRTGFSNIYLGAGPTISLFDLSLGVVGKHQTMFIMSRLSSPGKSFFFFFSLAILVLAACKKDIKSFIVGVNIETAFEQDQVQVFLDGQKKIDAQATTQWTIGVCVIDGKITDTTIMHKGEHEIRVIINNSITHAEKFSLNSNLFLRILFDRQANKVSIVYSKTRPIYD